MSLVAVVDVDHDGAVGLAEAIRAAGHDPVLVGLEPAGRPESDIERVVAPALDVRVSPPTLVDSYRLLTHLASRSFDAIVFADRGGHGYCAARARQLGVCLGHTRVISVCHGPLWWRAERDRAPWLTIDDVRRAVCERLQIELSDTVVADDDLVGWLRGREWRLPSDVVPDTAEDWANALEPGRESAAAREVEQGRETAVTAVVTHHERPHLLPICLAGLARQVHEDLEVVVVDDGSATTEARRGLDALEARTWPWPLRVVRLQSSGPAHARNAGWRHARTPLVAFVDDDDVAFDEMISTLVRARGRSGADVVVAGVRSFEGDGAPRPSPSDVVGIFLGQPYEFSLLENQYGCAAALWPTELLEGLGGFRPQPGVAGDGELLARATVSGAEVVALPTPVYWMRRTPHSQYSQARSTMRETWPAVVGALHASRIPPGYQALPMIAGGAYLRIEQLEREAVQPGRTRWRPRVSRIVGRRQVPS